MILGLTIAALISSATAAWSDGHVGVSREGTSGARSSIDATVAVNTSSDCFHLCHGRAPQCTAWTFVPQGCNHRLRATCVLHRTVRPARTVSAPECARITSGTVAAVEGLLPLAWKPLKLGSIRPAGWLRDQLVIFANGLSGHLDLFWADVNESVWIGGGADHSGAGHERGPYWLNGMVPLVAQLNASGDIASVTVDINQQVEHWVHYILDHQLPSGWLGPDDGFGGKGNDYWSGWNTAASLLSYADAMPAGDPTAARCNAAVLAYIKVVYTRMQATPFTAWSQNRWQDWVYIIHWLLDTAPQEQEQLLWDAAELTQQQSWDWDAYYAQSGVGTTGAFVGKSIPKFPEDNVGGWTMYDHGVNNGMGTKSCATWYRQSKNDTDAANTYHKLAMQDKFQGQPHGMFSADECFGGRNLNRGIELCAVVEQMYSLQHIFRVQGDASILDKHERIQYNALPGTITPTSWAHQYLQQANEINALWGLSEHVWQTDGGDSTGFGVAPNFGCCTANMQQGWPKMVNNILLENTNGDLLLALIAPVSAPTLAQGSVVVDTVYPFGDTVSISITKVPKEFKLSVRIPGWATHATATVTSGGKRVPSPPPQNGTLFTVSVLPNTVTSITLDLNPTIRVETGWGNLGQAAVSPVVYSPTGAALPTANASDFVFAGGAAMTDDADRHSTDIRTGDPGDKATITFAHSLDGRGHNISGFRLSFRYVTGYGPRGPITGKPSPTVSLTFVDPSTQATVAVGWSSDPLDKASYDQGDPFSAPVTVDDSSGLDIDNWGPLMATLVVNNNGRNLQIDLASLSLTIFWSSKVDPRPSPPPHPFLTPPTNAMAVLRGPLVYSLLLEEQAKEVRTWQPFGNLDVDIVTTSTWNYALDLSQPMQFVPLGAPSSIPFNTSHYPNVIRATARALPSWTARMNASNEPPPSPIDCTTIEGGCGPAVTVTLVPYGMTDLRMAGLPWIPAASATESS